MFDDWSSLLLLASDGVSDWLPDNAAMGVALRALEQVRHITEYACKALATWFGDEAMGVALQAMV